jgi:glucose-1-phosphatase
MTISHKIRNILFDLGGVLLNIDPILTGKALVKLGTKDMQKVHELLTERQLYQRFDSAKCTEADFRNEVREACEINITDDQVDAAWNALLLDFPASRVKLLHELRKNYKIYLLSNTNSIHFRSYTKGFREVHGEEMEPLFDKLFLSYELGAHKPDPEIYKRVIASGILDPAETLFIDDSLVNARAAADAGFVGFHLSEGMEVTSLFINGKLRNDAELLIS